MPSFKADLRPLTERVLSSISQDGNGCWIWTGSYNADGYGQLSIKGRTTGAHRASYTAFRGDIPAGHQVDHTCFVLACVNPDHLEAVTRQENIRRRDAYYGGWSDYCQRRFEERRKQEAQAAA